MESSGGTWIGFGIQPLLHYPQTHPGAAKCALQKNFCKNSLLLRQIDNERGIERKRDEREEKARIITN